MPLTIEVPTEGAMPMKAALVSVALPSGVTVNVPTDGELQIIGAFVVGTLAAGVFTPGQLN